MNKITTLVTLLLISMPTLMARQISEDEALQKAKRFSTNKIENSQLMKQGKVDNALKLSYSYKEAGENLYYVFNRGENQGFVIISGDDRAYEILGYSNEGTFDYSNIPDNMKGWLNIYAEDLKVLMNNPEEATIKPKFENKNYANTIAPLLGKIAWNQDNPYNKLCPEVSDGDLAATGCVATAMAQVMYYNQWPVKGVGNHSYVHEDNTLSADFGNTTYEWAKMTPTYNSKSTVEAENAVAVLMYHCGVSLDMEYGTSSSAQSNAMGKALYTYFRYDKGMRYLNRPYYGINEWVDLIKNELNNKRAICYGGQSKDGGHKFVLDGYDVNSMFHINWGWGGMSNGYFQINALTPSTQGIGGSSSGYNTSQNMLIGIQKETGTSTQKYEIIAKDGINFESAEIDRNAQTTIYLNKTYNYSWEAFEGSIALGIYRGDVLVQVIATRSIELDSFFGYSSMSFANTSIPSDITSGDYQLYPIYKSSDTAADWIKVRVTIGKTKYLNLTVNSDKVKFSLPTDLISNLTATDIVAKGKIYSNKISTISCKVANTGGEFYGNITLQLKRISDGIIALNFPKQIVNLNNGESTQVDFIDTFSTSAGDYLAYIMCNNTIISNMIPITILPEPTEVANLSLVTKISFPDNNNVPKDNMRLSAKITNNGGYFVGNILAYIYPLEDGKSLYSTPIQLITIDKGETIDVTLSGQCDLDNGQYFTSIYAIIDNKYVKMSPFSNSKVVFTLVDPSGIESVTTESTVIYPNPAIDFIGIKSESVIKAVKIYNMTGSLVQTVIADIDTQKMNIDISGIAAGNYIVQVVEENGTSVKQLIKK